MTIEPILTAGLAHLAAEFHPDELAYRRRSRKR